MASRHLKSHTHRLGKMAKSRVTLRNGPTIGFGGTIGYRFNVEFHADWSDCRGHHPFCPKRKCSKDIGVFLYINSNIMAEQFIKISKDKQSTIS